MSLAAQIVLDNANVFADSSDAGWGETATYTSASGGTPSAAFSVVFRDASAGLPDEMAVFGANAVDVTPAIGGWLTFSGTDYRVESYQLDAGWYTILATPIVKTRPTG